MSIGKICKRNIITAPADMSIYEITKLMKDNNIGNIIITNDNNIPIGIITDRDIIIRVIANEENARNIYANEIMSKDLLILKEYHGISESLEMICAKGVRRAPVVNEMGSLIGIVSADDIILLIADEMESYGRLIRKQLMNV